MKALFFHAVWGKEYISNFLRYSIPTQIAAGNLDAVDADSVFLIATLEEDVHLFEDSREILAIKKLMLVEYHRLKKNSVDALVSVSKYFALSHLQSFALERSRDFDVLFFGYADSIWAKGTYKAGLEKIEEGYDAIFLPGHAVIEQTMRDSIDKFRTDSVDITFEKRALAQLICENLHPMAAATIVENRYLPHSSSYLMWTVPGQGYLKHAFHLHPLVLKVQKDDPNFFAPFEVSLDEEFIARLWRLCPKLYVSESSDEMLVCGLGDLLPGAKFHHDSRLLTPAAVACFAEEYAGLVHRSLLRRPIRLQHSDGDERSWSDVEQIANAFVSEVLNILSCPDSVLQLEWPAAYNARRKRVDRYQHWVRKPKQQSGSSTLKITLIRLAPSWTLNVLRIIYRRLGRFLD